MIKKFRNMWENFFFTVQSPHNPYKVIGSPLSWLKVKAAKSRKIPENTGKSRKIPHITTEYGGGFFRKGSYIYH